MAKEITLVLGSTSDWDSKKIDIKGQLERVTSAHDDLVVRVEFASAHNTPEKVSVVALGGDRVKLSGAGMSAALPGIIEACHTSIAGYQVNIGIPFSDPYFMGLSAFLAIAEMPPQNPVLCVGIDNVEGAVAMAYAMLGNNRNVQNDGYGIVLARLGGVSDEGYAKMAKKLDDTLGRTPDGSGGTKSIFRDAGRVVCVRSQDELPDCIKGKIVISVYSGTSPREEGAFCGIDEIASRTGGLQILVNSGEGCGIAEYAFSYARQFSGLKATGTVSVGGAGFTNAAQFAARVMGYGSSTENIILSKRKKHDDIMGANGYVVKNGKTGAADKTVKIEVN